MGGGQDEESKCAFSYLRLIPEQFDDFVIIHVSDLHIKNHKI